MANKENQATPKLIEIELDIKTNWAKSLKVNCLDLSSIKDNEYKIIQKSGNVNDTK